MLARTEPRPTGAAVRAASVALLLVILVGAAWVGWQGQRIVRADAPSIAARQQVARWIYAGAAPAASAEWVEAQASLNRAVAIAPDNPALHAALGDINAAAGLRDWQDDALREANFRAALAHYETAAALRPADALAWANIAASRHALGDDGPAFQRAWQRARELGPHELPVQPLLLDLALMNWAQGTPAMREWVLELWVDAGDAKRKLLNRAAGRFELAFTGGDAGAPARVGAVPASAPASTPASGALIPKIGNAP